MIIENNGKYYVCNEFVDENICFIVNTKEEAEKKLDELNLNKAFFLMFGTDDINVIVKSAKRQYLKDNQGKTFEQYYNDNFCCLGVSQRNIKITSDKSIEINNMKYLIVDNNSQINLSRNGKRFKYYEYDRISKIMKKILLLRSKKQGGLDFSNMLWSNELSSTIAYILFKELTPNLTEEQFLALKEYTGYKYSQINDFLYGKPILENNYYHFIDSLLKVYFCSIETPYDLYLHRGAGMDTEICRYGIDAKNPSKKLNEESMTYHYNQFISTSFNATAIKPFISPEELFLKVPRGARVIFKGILDAKESIENEVIIMPSNFECIKEDKDNIRYLLEFSQHNDFFELIINNLMKNKDYYISQMGNENFENLYEYTLKSIIKCKQQEIKKTSNSKDLYKKMSKLLEFINNHRFYGVIQETENYSTRHRI